MGHPWFPAAIHQSGGLPRTLQMCQTCSGKRIQRIVSVLVSEQHCCLGRPRHNRYVVGIWPRRRGFASALLKQWRYWWVLWKQASAGTYFSFNSVDIAVSVGTPLCYQSLNAFYSGVASVAQQRGQAEKFKPGGILTWSNLGLHCPLGFCS